MQKPMNEASPILLIPPAALMGTSLWIYLKLIALLQKRINGGRLRKLSILYSLPLVFLMLACQTTPQWAPFDAAKRDIYPATHWQKAPSPGQIGWSSDKLAAAREYSKKIDTAAEKPASISCWTAIPLNGMTPRVR